MGLRLWATRARASAAALAVWVLVACGGAGDGAPGGANGGANGDGGNGGGGNGSGPPPPVTGAIGPEGGTLTSDGATVVLEVPAGALTSAVEITIAPDADAIHPWSLPGTGFVFEPEGIAFAVPARLRVSYDADASSVHDAERGLALYRVDGDDWERLESRVDTTARTVEAEIDGFSAFALRREAPLLTLWGGSIHAVTLVPFASASVRANACIAGACSDIEEEDDEFYPGLPTFSPSDDGCGFMEGWSLEVLQLGMPGDLASEAGVVSLDMQASKVTDPTPGQAVLEVELNAFAQPVHRPGHNVLSRAVGTIDFFRLDPFAPGERRVLLDIDNPGGAPYDLAVAWSFEGGAAGPHATHVMASAEVAPLSCAQPWEHVEVTTLFSTVVTQPIGSETEALLEEAGLRRLPGSSEARSQVWIGFHAHVNAGGAHGDDEGSLGYGFVSGGQAAVSGGLAFVAEPLGE